MGTYATRCDCWMILLRWHYILYHFLLEITIIGLYKQF